MTRALGAAAAVLALTASPPAQSRPDFSGTWTLDESRSASATHDGFVSPVVWTIRQTADALTVDIRRGPRTSTLVYRIYPKRLIGAPADGALAHRAFWEGDRLVTETIQTIQGQTVITEETRALLPGGREMQVDRIVKVEHGYTLRGAQSYNAAKDVFVRSVP
jgi:hypothetical protein